MRGRSILVFTTILVLSVPAAAWADGVDATAAFESLKALAGDWKGDAVGHGAAAEGETEQHGEVIHNLYRR